MKIAYTICRVLLGLVFAVLGLNIFVLFMPPPPANVLPHDVVTFNTLMFASHYMWVVGASQLVGGVLVLLNRFTGFALIVLGAVLVNVLTFHIAMWPQSLFPLPVLALILWVITAWPLRERFAQVFVERV